MSRCKPEPQMETDSEAQFESDTEGENGRMNSPRMAKIQTEKGTD